MELMRNVSKKNCPVYKMYFRNQFSYKLWFLLSAVKEVKYSPPSFDKNKFTRPTLF